MTQRSGFNLKSLGGLFATNERTTASSDSSDKPLGESLLAFRTITTLLARIQQQSSTSDDTLHPDTEEERRELSILNALATVIVMGKNGVVAAAATRHSENGELGVLACQQLNLNNEASTSTSSRPTLLHFFINKNPRKDTVVKNTALVIGDAKNSRVSWDDSDPEAEKKLIEYVHNRWWVLCYNIAAIHDIIYNRSGETFESHVWNLMKLLVLPNPGEELLPYVVATCFEKIRSRLANRSSPTPYLTSLREVETFEFKELFPPLLISESQRNSDRLLFASFPLLGFSAELPGLTEQATRAADNKPYELYTKDTYWEFHQLLVKLLESFQEGLDGLLNCRGASVEPEAGSPEFLKQLRKALSYGYALQRMVQGSGIKHYLQNLAPSLGDHRRQERGNSTMMDEPTEDLDMDLLQIQPGVIGTNGEPQSVWKSYLDWLNLILAHFNAVEVLVRFVSSPHLHTKVISIKILTSPNVSQQKLSWKEVLKNPKFFPVGLHMSNEKIVECLSSGISSRPDATLFALKIFLGIFRLFTQPSNSLAQNCLINENAIKAFKSPTHSKGIEKICSNVAKLLVSPDDSKSISNINVAAHSLLETASQDLRKHKPQTCWTENTEQICSNLAKLKEVPGDSESISKINEAGHLLQDYASIYKLFRDIDSKPFDGAVHCEATIASLFLFQPSSDTDFSSLLKVIYIAFILCAV